MRKPLRTSERHGALALALLLLAGCVTPAPDGKGPSDGIPSPGIVLADLTSASCAYNDVIFLVSREHAQSFLPEGFHARTILVQSDATAAIVTNVIACGEGFAWNAADTFVVVERVAPPAWMEAFDGGNRTPREEEPPGDTLYLDLYMLAGFTGHEGLRALFERAGMPVAPAEVAKTALPAPAGSAATGQVTDGEGALLAFAVSGRPLGGLFAHHRQWRETPEGLVLVERHMSADGAPIPLTQGPAECVVRPGSLLADLTGGASCSLGQDAPGGFGWEGRAYLFPGQRGAALAG